MTLHDKSNFQVLKMRQTISTFCTVLSCDACSREPRVLKQVDA